MAKQVVADVIYFDAASQSEGKLTSGSVLDIPLYIRHFVVYGGATGGTVAIHDKSAGNIIVPSTEIAADDETVIPIGSWWDGIFITTLDAGITVQAHVGDI